MVDRTLEERRAYFLERLRIGDKWADHVADMIMKAGKTAYASLSERRITQALGMFAQVEVKHSDR
jgi:hypothetical protein